jgi:hypothetical protein
MGSRTAGLEGWVDLQKTRIGETGETPLQAEVLRYLRTVWTMVGISTEESRAQEEV